MCQTPDCCCTAKGWCHVPGSRPSVLTEPCCRGEEEIPQGNSSPRQQAGHCVKTEKMLLRHHCHFVSAPPRALRRPSVWCPWTRTTTWSATTARWARGPAHLPAQALPPGSWSALGELICYGEEADLPRGDLLCFRGSWSASGRVPLCLWGGPALPLGEPAQPWGDPDSPHGLHSLALAPMAPGGVNAAWAEGGAAITSTKLVWRGFVPVH